MPRWLEITLTLVLFTVAMTVFGWVARSGVEWAFPRLLGHIGLVGIWAGLVALWITGGVLLYREKAGKAGKAAGA